MWGAGTGFQAITLPPLNRPMAGLQLGASEQRLIAALTAGGDARITLHPETGLNRYLSAPHPRDILAYSSSTVSDISQEAFAHLLTLDQSRDYGEWLSSIGARIRAAYGLGDAAQIVFAPSGTDLEYVALACVLGRGSQGIHNVLLGADEIGSGCIHSAIGRYFAKETALGLSVEPTADVEGMGPVSMVDIPVRCGAGNAQESALIFAQMEQEIEAAQAQGKHCLIHGVHGSKTGLVLPDIADLALVQSRHGDAVTFVIDACQARITSAAIARYMELGAIVLMTGSKFIGAPPFNGWAIIPQTLAESAAPLPAGFASIFRRAEWPQGWPGRSVLEDTANTSLALRLEAAVFELERFQAIPLDRVEAIISAFEAALTTHCIEPLGARRIIPGGIAHDLPVEMRTLATLDVSMLPGLTTFDEAQGLHKALALDGVRLGQPVKCVAGPDGWGGTLRIGLSMPHFARWAEWPMHDIEAELARDMGQIAAAVQQMCAEPAQ